MKHSSLSANLFLLHFDDIMSQLIDKKLIQKIALQLKKLRSEKGVSQIDVYNDTNIHIGRLETGRYNMSVSALSALCKYFKIKMSDFHKMVEE